MRPNPGSQTQGFDLATLLGSLCFLVSCSRLIGVTSLFHHQPRRLIRPFAIQPRLCHVLADVLLYILVRYDSCTVYALLPCCYITFVILSNCFFFTYLTALLCIVHEDPTSRTTHTRLIRHRTHSLRIRHDHSR
jgi:hypothetical protein